MAEEKPEKEHLTAEDAEKRYDIRQNGEFCSVPDKAVFVVPTGVIGGDGREIAIEVPWHVMVRALAEDMELLTKD